MLAAAVAAVGVTFLQPSTTLDRFLTPGATAVFEVRLAPNQTYRGSLDQRESDLSVAISDPDGRMVATIDQWERGTELFTLRSGGGGQYRLTVRAARPTVRAGRYLIRIDPSSDDHDRVDLQVKAVAMATDAKRMYDRRDAPSLTEAVALRQGSLTLWRTLGNRGAELATVSNIGDAYYRLSRFDNADAAFRDALAMSRAARNRRSEGEALNNLGMVAWPRGNVSEAIDRLREALEIWRELRHTYGEAATLTNLGILLWEAGELDEAQRHHARARAIFQRLRDLRGEGYVLTNRAVALDTLGKPHAALSDLTRAIALFARTHDPIAQGRALVRYARIHLSLGNRRTAIRSVERALPLIRQSAERLAEADALEVLGRVHAAMGDRAAAGTNYTRALDHYRAVGSRRGESNVFHDLGLLALAGHDPTAALGLFSQARELRREIGTRSLEADSLMNMARAARAAGDLAAALDHHQTALAIVEETLSSVFERELRITFSQAVQRYHLEYVDLLLEMDRLKPDAGYLAKAFETADRAKARGLVEQLRRARAGPPSGDARALVNREKALRHQIAYLSWALWKAADRPPMPEPGGGSAARLERAIEEHQRVEADLWRAPAMIAATLRTPLISLDEVQRDLLTESTVLIEYMLGTHRSVAMVVTKHGVEAIELPGQAAIERRVNEYYALVSRPGPRPRAALDAATARLTHVLLSPVTTALGHARVIVVPDGILHYVPFAALPRPGGTTPLSIDREILQIPSATMWATQRGALGGRSRAPRLFAIFANPVSDTLDGRVSPRAGPRATFVNRFAPLPFSAREAAGLAALAGAAPTLQALGFEATPEAVRTHNLSQYRYVHFATHATRDDRHPELSAIVLSMVNPDGSARDGFLRLQDVYALRLNADLVSLSACETGLGRLAGAEGLLSLARGFFFAGARRVMVTLWSVEDDASATMMKAFYTALLSSPDTPAAALASAQAAMRRTRRWADPYYWAGFVILGT